MGLTIQPTVRSYFSKNPLLKNKIFPSIINGKRYELLCKFLQFVDNNTYSTFNGPKKLFKVYPILTYLDQKFKSAYNLSQNISIDESLLLWNGLLSWRQYIPLKAAKFGLKTFELCESSTGYT